MDKALNYINQVWNHAGFQKYFRNMGWSFSGQFLSLVMSFFVGALVARHLGPEQYGVLNYAISFVTIFVFIASFGVDNILVRELIKLKDKKDSVLNTAFVLKLFGAFLVIILTFLFSVLLKNSTYTTVLIFIYSIHLIFLSINVISSYFQSVVKHKYIFLAQSISTIAVSLLKVYMVYQGFGTGWFIMALVLEVAIFSFILLRAFSKNDLSLKFSFDLGLTKKLLADSWPFILSTGFYLIYTKIDQVIIGKMVDIRALGIYSAGARLAELWYFVPGIICAAMFPAIMNASLTDKVLYKKRLKKMFIFVTSISLFFALMQLLFAKHIILFLFGQAYLDATAILKVYTWAGVVVSSIIMFQQYLIIENKTKTLIISSFVGAFANVILNLIFIPKFGIIGSAWATLISYAIIPVAIVVQIEINRIRIKHV